MGEVAIKLSTDSARVANPQVCRRVFPTLTRSGRLMQRVMVYVVGFNLYYRLLTKGMAALLLAETLRQSVEEWGYD